MSITDLFDRVADGKLFHRFVAPLRDRFWVRPVSYYGYQYNHDGHGWYYITRSGVEVYDLRNSESARAALRNFASLITTNPEIRFTPLGLIVMYATNLITWNQFQAGRKQGVIHNVRVGSHYYTVKVIPAFSNSVAIA